ncbi:MAG: ion transporter [Verrucomicrobiales bacterium]|nr:ion transporter [Verrucomicrobiales bacterium]
MLNDLANRAKDHQSQSLRDKVWRIIFLSDTKAGKAFDVVLLWLIGVSILVVMLESVESLDSRHHDLFRVMEWIFTILFTIEYAVRIWVVRKKRAYIFSFFGIVDLLSIIPTYLTLFDFGVHYLVVVRILRLLRIFRVLKMARYLGEANLLINALRSSLPKITVFLFCVFAVTAILGTLMYLVEGILGKNEGFSSVPHSIYWAIVTISTVGYGDVIPITVVGKMIATVIMLTGFGIIAVPTGIVIGELNMSMRKIQPDNRVCGECGHSGHDPKAGFCKMCGNAL